jgi:uracil phosphoribosyltransferase
LTLQAVEYYNKLPQTPNATVCFILDPLIATGGTARAAINIMHDWGVRRLKFMTVCAYRNTILELAAEFPDVEFYVGVVDDKLSDKGYVSCGVGNGCVDMSSLVLEIRVTGSSILLTSNTHSCYFLFKS